MSFSWIQLENAVTNAIRAGSIGSPRALRVTMHVACEKSAVSQLSDVVISAASKWFDGDPIHRWSNVNTENIRVEMVKWANGSSALVSISRGRGGTFGGDFTLLGSKGSTYHRFAGAGE